GTEFFGLAVAAHRDAEAYPDPDSFRLDQRIRVRRRHDPRRDQVVTATGVQRRDCESKALDAASAGKRILAGGRGLPARTGTRR
ncbi:MAG: hypothetical protein HOY75_21615, partial [Streptomyces sp.]|nr:hypothetical protein [Streptomyces sp.]